MKEPFVSQKGSDNGRLLLAEQGGQSSFSLFCTLRARLAALLSAKKLHALS